MVINSLNFLLFFAIFFLVYYFFSNSKAKWQNGWILLGSYVFYALTDWKMIYGVILSTVIFYYLGILIHKYSREKVAPPSDNIFPKHLYTKSSVLTTLGIVVGIGMLLYFKYFNFFIQSFSRLFDAFGLHTNPHSFNIVLPLGISFFTFKLMSYVIEVHRRTIEPSQDFVEFASYVAFFPTLMCGPIDRPGKFLPQLRKDRLFNYPLAIDGCKQILWGMVKKMLIADNLAIFINGVWAGENFNSGVYWLAMFFYSIQIYADFSGYSDMAIGVGKLLGIRVAKNFDYPYFARNVSEFWRKWHISLTSWFTDYVYIPLGGSRKGKLITIINTLIVFTICGLWHGADWSFVLWGFLNGLLFVPYLLQSTPRKYKNEPIKTNTNTFCRIVLMFLLASFCWVFFRADNTAQAGIFVSKLFTEWSEPFNLSALNDRIWYTLGMILTIIVLVIEWKQRNKEYALVDLIPWNSPVLKIAFYVVLFFFIYLCGGDGELPMYAVF